MSFLNNQSAFWCVCVLGPCLYPLDPDPDLELWSLIRTWNEQTTVIFPPHCSIGTWRTQKMHARVAQCVIILSGNEENVRIQEIIAPKDSDICVNFFCGTILTKWVPADTFWCKLERKTLTLKRFLQGTPKPVYFGSKLKKFANHQMKEMRPFKIWLWKQKLQWKCIKSTHCALNYEPFPMADCKRKSPWPDEGLCSNAKAPWHDQNQIGNGYWYTTPLTCTYLVCNELKPFRVKRFAHIACSSFLCVFQWMPNMRIKLPWLHSPNGIIPRCSWQIEKC